MRYFRYISISISRIFPGYLDVSYLVISYDISQIPISCDISHDIKYQYVITCKYTQVVVYQRDYACMYVVVSGPQIPDESLKQTHQHDGG